MSPLLQCLGQALAHKGLPGLLGTVPMVGLLIEVATDAFHRWRLQADEEQRRAQLLELLQASPGEVRREAAAMVSDLPEKVGESVVAYLSLVPATIRRSCRRPDDPAGRSLPPELRMGNVDDLLSLLPQRLPRFRPGERVLGGVWQLEELLGVGGFGEVWKARHPHLRNIPRVALKFCLDNEASASLRREAALLDHILGSGCGPGIVALRNAYLDTDPVCVEYELVEGGDLAALATTWKAEDRPKRAAEMIATLAEIVGRMHRLSPPVVHRDLKPSNILIRPDGQAVIADFGLGALIADREVREEKERGSRSESMAVVPRGAYTPLYASPQQRNGLVPDPRDDVFSLGVIWYQLILGDFSREVGIDGEDDLRDAGVGGEQIELLRMCLSQRPDRRPSNAADLCARLRSERSEVVVAREGGDFSSISAALRQLGSGGRIRLRAGVYRENVVLDQSVAVVADEGAVLECSEGTALTVRAELAMVSGLTVVRREGGRGHALDVAAGRPTFEGCTFRGGTLSCVEVRGEAVPTFRSCTIRESKDTGVSLSGRAGGVFVVCTVANNAGEGVSLRTEGEPSFERCQVKDNGLSGIVLHGGQVNVLSCTMSDNGRLGLTASGGARPDVRDCHFERNAQGGVWLHGEAGGRFEVCEFSSNGRSAINLSTGANPLFTACRLTGGTAGGIFVFDGGRGLLEMCEIVGHGLANVETRDGGDPLLRHCKIHDGKAAGVNAHTGGRGTLERCDLSGHIGSGVVVKSGSMVRLVGCQIHDGKASGAFVLDGAEVVLDSCVITGNALAGVEARDRGRALVTSCALRLGRTSGVFANVTGRIVLDGCELTGNQSAGIVACERGEIVATDCTVSESRANGVFLYRGGRGTFTKCQILRNTKAGFEIREEAVAEIQDCLVNENGYEGLWLHGNGVVTVTQSDLRKNRRGAFDIGPGCRATQEHNLT